MRTAWTVLLFLVATLTQTRIAHAADVLVVGPSGAVVPDAAVACVGSEDAAVLTDSQGRAAVPDTCRRVSCMSGFYLPGTVELGASPATCALAEGARIVVVVPAPGCGPHCFVSLVPESTKFSGVHREVREDPQTGGVSVRLPLVPTGAYVVEVRGDRYWSCRKRIQLATPGESSISAVWRPPAVVRGTVLSPAGRPVPDMPVRVSAQPPGSDWSCATDPYAPDVFTSADGTFELRVDPGAEATVEAGSSWDPDGYGSAAVTRAADPIVLRVRASSLP
jgi:hypothetical protein